MRWTRNSVHSGFGRGPRRVSGLTMFLQNNTRKVKLPSLFLNQVHCGPSITPISFIFYGTLNDHKTYTKKELTYSETKILETKGLPVISVKSFIQEQINYKGILFVLDVEGSGGRTTVMGNI